MQKKLTAGLFSGVTMLIIGMAVSQLFIYFFPSLKTEYENKTIFREWEDPIMSIYFLHPIILGFLLAWVWSKIKSLVIKQVSFLDSGIYFGILYWIITIPGMIISYSTFQVSFFLVFSWSISILIQSVCAGFIYSRMIR